ncbi:MAG: T9SS type A sorting domain-containing protein [Bacteroidetes bacterium]|nr:T9SS type A sorting domain-containing protein [Bacteroidota bacterium]
MKKNGIILCTSLLFLCSLFSLQKVFAASDTVFVVSLEVNMTKAVRSGIFDPSLDHLYAVFDTGMSDQQLVNSGNNKFTLILSQGFDSGAIYHFRFRINNFITETVDRQILIGQGVNYYYCWWNNDYLNSTWFQVDMSYLVQQGSFRPDTDFVDVAGTMNNFQGSPPLTRIGSGYIYQTMYNIEPGAIAAFKFRINGDSNKTELKGKPFRFLLAPDSVIHSLYWFDNFNPSKVPMQFYCNLKYMTRAGHFSRQNDHVDVAGSFNGNGSFDILYDNDKDSIYTATVLIDTAFYNLNPLTFKYRINSSWETSELKGKPFRTYVLHDTSSGRNIDSSWYNNWNPRVPTPPVANNVAIQGNDVYKQVLTGVYSYENINGISEGISKYQWYQSADSLGINLTAIDTATHITYTIDSTCIHKWLVFEVIPVADSGDSAVGKPVRIITKSSVGYVGIAGHDNLISLVYPNPSTSLVVVDGLSEINRIELYDLTGRTVFVSGELNSRQNRINPSGLMPGIYILKAIGKENQTGWARIIRQ